MKIHKQKKKFLFLWWGGLAIFLLFFHGDQTLNNQEGIVLNGAWNIINGRELYVDFFEHIAPGSFYLVAFLWKIFGPRYWIANLIGMLAIYLGAVGVYKTSLKFSKNRIALLFPMIYVFSSLHWSMINYNTLSVFFLIWGTYFFVKGLQKGKVANFVSSGLFIGISTLFVQHKGVSILLFCLGFLIITWIMRKRGFWKKSLAVFTLFSLLPLLTLLKWPIEIIYSSLVNKLEINTTYPVATIFFLVLLLYLVLIFKKFSLELVFIIILQLVLLIFAFSHADNFNLALAIFPLLVIFPYASSQISSKKLFQKTLFFALAGIAAWMLLYPTLSYVATFQPTYSNGDQDQIRFIEHNCPGKNSLYAGPYLPGVYYETSKLNPTSFSWLITEHHTEGHFKKARRELEVTQPKCVLINYQETAGLKYSQDNPIDKYIKDNYNETRVFADFRIFERK